VYALLLIQVTSGVYTAATASWGSSWFAAVVAPYLWSLVWLRPDVAAVAALPLIVRVHILSAFLLVGAFPYSRLVHIVSAPIAYTWRKPQLVRWNRQQVLPVED
jgi:nitrate reductase gamma subunit